MCASSVEFLLMIIQQSKQEARYQFDMGLGKEKISANTCKISNHTSDQHGHN